MFLVLKGKRAWSRAMFKYASSKQNVIHTKKQSLLNSLELAPNAAILKRTKICFHEKIYIDNSLTSSYTSRSTSELKHEKIYLLTCSQTQISLHNCTGWSVFTGHSAESEIPMDSSRAQLRPIRPNGFKGCQHLCWTYCIGPNYCKYPVSVHSQAIP